jgi:hypothetical protein
MPLNEFRAVHLPYCLKRLPDGRYVALNRRYKPLGFNTLAQVEYEKYPIAVKFKGLTRKVASKLSHKGSEELEDIFLYDDSCVPTRSAQKMQAYLRRLAILAKLRLA